jgi:hypothetical protein
LGAIRKEEAMEHPQAVCEKAQRVAQLLQRVTAGECFESVRAALGLRIAEREVPQLQARYAKSGQRWEALVDGRYGHWQTVKPAVREWLYARKRQAEGLTAPALGAEIEAQFGICLSAGHINYLLRKEELTRPPGRPPVAVAPAEPGVATVKTPPQSLEQAGIFFPRSGKV